MKNKGKFLFILMFATLFLLYRVDSVAAMENIQPDTFDMNNEANVEAEQLAETVSEPKTEWPTEPALSSETEQPAEPALEPETEQPAEPALEPETEWPTEPALSSETEQPAEPALASETEQLTEPALSPAAEQPTEPVSEPEADFVTTGAALIEWLESHKNTGGTVKLADNVVLEGYYSFCPDGPNMPSVFVDTDKYMITVA